MRPQYLDGTFEFFDNLSLKNLVARSFVARPCGGTQEVCLINMDWIQALCCYDFCAKRMVDWCADPLKLEL